MKVNLSLKCRDPYRSVVRKRSVYCKLAIIDFDSRV